MEYEGTDGYSKKVSKRGTEAGGQSMVTSYLQTDDN
jgi:hypothetical protein